MVRIADDEIARSTGPRAKSLAISKPGIEAMAGGLGINFIIGGAGRSPMGNARFLQRYCGRWIRGVLRGPGGGELVPGIKGVVGIGEGGFAQGFGPARD